MTETSEEPGEAILSDFRILDSDDAVDRGYVNDASFIFTWMLCRLASELLPLVPAGRHVFGRRACKGEVELCLCLRDRRFFRSNALDRRRFTFAMDVFTSLDPVVLSVL